MKANQTQFRLDPALVASLRRPPVLSLADAEKCWGNALRLYRDSKGCSPLTKSALVELGLEETAKAGMILFRERIARRLTSEGNLPISHATDLPAEKQLDDLLLKNLDLFTADSIDLAFRRHEIKLRFFEFSLEWLRDSIPLGLSKEYRRESRAPAFAKLIATLYSVGPMQKELQRRVDGLVSALKSRGISDLGELAKETGFYVDRSDDSSHCVIPVADKDLFRALARGATAIHFWTLSMLHSARRRETEFESWSLRRYVRWLRNDWRG